MSQTFTVQREIRVYDDKDGSYVRIGMDPDALDLVEIASYDGIRPKEEGFVNMTRERARLVAQAIIEYLDSQPAIPD